MITLPAAILLLTFSNIKLYITINATLGERGFLIAHVFRFTITFAACPIERSHYNVKKPERG